MNKERILQLADFIEKLPAKRFDMTEWLAQNDKQLYNLPDIAKMEHKCGTVGCIAGWAAGMFAGEWLASHPEDVDLPLDQAARLILGLTAGEGHELFMRHWSPKGLMCTQTDAVAHLRSLAAKE